jgi:hypothetical protein
MPGDKALKFGRGRSTYKVIDSRVTLLFLAKHLGLSQCSALSPIRVPCAYLRICSNGFMLAGIKAPKDGAVQRGFARFGVAFNSGTL